AGALYRGAVDVQRGGDLVVERAFAGPQQRVGAADHLGGGFALSNQEEQSDAILLAQLDSIRLRSHENLPVGGRTPPPHLLRLCGGAPLGAGCSRLIAYSP